MIKTRAIDSLGGLFGEEFLNVNILGKMHFLTMSSNQKMYFNLLEMTTSLTFLLLGEFSGIIYSFHMAVLEAVENAKYSFLLYLCKYYY